MTTNQGMPSTSYRSPKAVGNHVVAQSGDLLRAEINGRGLARSWNQFRMR
ncbi:MAG: hypothetical protein R3281_03115 [Balneolaceae bacterium]|nr:hypothetical protein [Balneolaceae bacterium]